MQYSTISDTRTIELKGGCSRLNAKKVLASRVALKISALRLSES